MSNVSIEKLTASEFETELASLAGILHQCVQQGASIGFVQPFSIEQSQNFWQNNIYSKLLANKLVLFIAKIDGVIGGCVVLDLDTMPNQTHRADVAKLMVHPNFQRLGVAKKLMHALESHALLVGRSLLVLDTKTGDNAEPLYLSLGYIISGTIPDFAQNPELDGYAATTIMYKTLRW